MKISNIFTSWDIWASLVITGVLIFLLPNKLDILFVKDAYFAGLTVLAVVFAIFFASLAIIMSSSQDEFIKFLEEDGEYTKIVSAFRYTLILLFIALVLSLVAYIVTSYQVSQKYINQPQWLFLFFAFCSLYSLFAVFMSSSDVISYSKYRTKFLNKSTSEEKDGI